MIRNKELGWLSFYFSEVIIMRDLNVFCVGVKELTEGCNGYYKWFL